MEGKKNGKNGKKTGYKAMLYLLIEFKFTQYYQQIAHAAL
jgi:hypothetical protein